MQNIAVSILLFMFLFTSFSLYGKIKEAIIKKADLHVLFTLIPALLGALTWFVYHL